MASFLNMNVQLKEFRQKLEQAKKEVAQSIAPMLQQFLKDYPEVDSVFWTQYTPYFNDGSICVFSLGETMFTFTAQVNSEHYEDLEEDDYDYACYLCNHYEKSTASNWCSEETFDACSALQESLEGSKEVLEAAFGDHVKVIVTREGISVEEYDHD